MDKSVIYSERFLNSRDRVNAVRELQDLGSEAVQILEPIFSGEAKNKFDVPYNKLGMPIECSLVVIKLLGSTAKGLESYVRHWADQGHPYALEALDEIKST